jgi:hypothetical protein
VITTQPTCGPRPDLTTRRDSRRAARRAVIVGLGLAAAVAGCGSGDSGTYGGAPGTPDPAGTSSAAAQTSPKAPPPSATRTARALCAAIPLDAAHALLPSATTPMPYATSYGPSCAYLTKAGTKADAFVDLRLLDRIAAMNRKSPTAFAEEQASYRHAVPVPGLRYGTFYDRGVIGIEEEIDWYQGGHNYALSVSDGRSSRPAKPSLQVMAAQAEAIASRLPQ